MKRIVTVQDISCIGKCSLTVALPIISAMGIETAIIPTAVLSTHTAFHGGFTFRDLTEDITPIMNHWEKEKFEFDGIYTGYLGSLEQIDLMKDLISRFGKDSRTVKIVDPCMADGGKLYPGFNEEFAAHMATLCGEADIILPNLSEASFLLGEKYMETGYTEDDIKALMKRLAALGCRKVVLKGVVFNEDQKDLRGVKGKIGICCYDSEKGSYSWYFHKRISTSFHGTGDIFASVFTGALLNGFSIEKSYALAGDFVVKSIEETLSHENYNTYGVDFEAVIPYLVKELEKRSRV